jgi:hypothetical protein
MAETSDPETSATEGDTSEPVTEAVPEASGDHSLVGERAVGENGTYATEAEPELPGDKS